MMTTYNGILNELQDMNAHPLDYSDIPSLNDGEYRPLHEELLNKLPVDIVRELARRRLDEIKATGYAVSSRVPEMAG
jgi:hypothetical protein